MRRNGDGWQDIPEGGLITSPGSSRQNHTGSWRSEHPVIDFTQCTHCMICWVLCPDTCFRTKDGVLLSVDLDFCKGCGICAAECPRHCIKMAPEVSSNAVAPE